MSAEGDRRNCTVRDRTGPTFLGIGSQRCATSFINQVLDAHPRVQMAPKEPNFYNYNWQQKGLDWYLQLFNGPSDTEGGNGRGGSENSVHSLKL